jgi:hypothetical protein
VLMLYTIYRNTYPIHTCRPTGEQKRDVMTNDFISFSFSHGQPVGLQIGDYIDVWGERYELVKEPDVTKDSTLAYHYDCQFVAQYYKLSKWKMRGLDSANALTLPEWELQGSLLDFLELAVQNANRMSTGWVVGTTDPNAAGVMKYLTFTSDNNILMSLSQIAEAFDTEWWVVGKTVHLTKRQEVSGHSFEYGYNNGIKGGLRRTGGQNDVFSRLFVQGSEQNIPSTYRNGQRRLQLPIGTPFLQGTKYGPDEIEADVIFDDIRPERVGVVTAVSGIQSFTDTGIDFDINAQLLPGISAKISFLTGNLSGYNFEIAKGGYDHTTKTVKFVTNDQEKGNILPDANRHPQVGDTYFFFDIVMPDTYVEAAQERLLANGQEHLSKNGIPKFTYDLPPDHFFFERNSTLLTLGDTVHVKDLDLGLNRDIRIVGYVRDLHDEFKYTSMILSDTAPMASIVRQYAEAEKTKKALEAGKVYDIQRSRSNWKTTNELTTQLNTVKAEMLLITMEGAAYSTDIVSTLSLTDFATTGGQIFHEQYTEGAQNGIWTVPPFTSTLLGTGSYYVYVRASRTANTAVIILSPTRIEVESDPANYYFPFGFISSVVDGTRAFQSLRGYTKVTGGQIGTGIIYANNGESWINLDEGTFNFENSEARLAFTDEGVVLDGKIIATNAEFVDLLVENFRTNPTGKRVQMLKSDNNIQIYNAADRVLIEADDDSAVESSYSSTTPPILDLNGNFPKNYLGQQITGGTTLYYYANLGPGVSVGISPTDANGFSTLGRKEVYTNGKFRAANASGLQESSIDRTGVRTTGILDVAGNSQLKGSVEVTGELKLWNPVTSSWIVGQNKRFAYSFGSDTYHFTTFNGWVYESGPGA